MMKKIAIWGWLGWPKAGYVIDGKFLVNGGLERLASWNR
jgi:hypothetical protein